MNAGSYTLHRHVSKNEVGRDFVIGDLHGCYHDLEMALKLKDFDTSKDRLFSVGDLVDRGPESLKCLQLVDRPWFDMVIGNHEDMMVTVHGGEAHFGEIVNASRVWSTNGGDWSVEGVRDEVERLSIKLLKEKSLTMTIDTDKGPVGLLHADPVSNDWEDMVDSDAEYDGWKLEPLLWGRDWHRRALHMLKIKNVHQVYCGHTPMANVKAGGNIMWIDTGCVYKQHADRGYGHLTLLQIN